MAKLIIIDSNVAEHSRLGQYMLRRVKYKNDVEITFYNAKDLISPSAKPKALTEYRTNVFFPMLDEQLPNVPVVVCGQHAARVVMGGNPTATSMAGKVYEVNGRAIAFTYGFDYIEVEGGLEHFVETVRTTLAPPFVAPTEYPDRTEMQTEVVIDVETTGKTFPWYGSDLVMIGFKPVGEPPIAFRPSDLDNRLMRAIHDSTTKVIGHNLMFDLQHLAYIGIEFPNAKWHDTMIYQKCTGREEESYGLKYLAKKYHKFPHWDAWFNTQLKMRVDTKDMEWEKLQLYNAGDLCATEALYNAQQKKNLTFNLEMDYLKYIFSLIRNGMKVDLEKLNALIEDCGQKQSALDQSLKVEYGLGEDFNFNSPAQLLNLLNRYVKTPIDATDIVTLEAHQEEAPIIKSIIELRDLAKLKGTSLEGLKKFVDNDSLVHSSVQVHGAETGRSSSSSPNLQNTDPRARALFISRYPEGRLVHTDLSGIEYRLIAHASQDRALCKIFRSGEDIHSYAFRQMFGRDPADKVERKVGKTANFGGVYGCAFNKFSTLTGLTGDEGKKAFKVVSGMYPGVEEWKSGVIAELRRSGIIRNLFGRVRYFSSATMDDEREAINWIIQSSGHDILKIYSMEMCDRIKEAGLAQTLLISEVHDSNTFDSPASEYNRVADIIKSLAEDLNPLILAAYGVKMRVPIIAEVEIMEHWA
jgi:DNA polymerase I